MTQSTTKRTDAEVLREAFETDYKNTHRCKPTWDKDHYIFNVEQVAWEMYCAAAERAAIPQAGEASAPACAIDGAEALPLCVGTCAKRGVCIERSGKLADDDIDSWPSLDEVAPLIESKLGYLPWETAIDEDVPIGEYTCSRMDERDWYGVSWKEGIAPPVGTKLYTRPAAHSSNAAPAPDAEAIRSAALEEAAKICDAKYAARVETGHPREASTAARLAEEIRALSQRSPAVKSAELARKPDGWVFAGNYWSENPPACMKKTGRAIFFAPDSAKSAEPTGGAA